MALEQLRDAAAGNEETPELNYSLHAMVFQILATKQFKVYIKDYE